MPTGKFSRHERRKQEGTSLSALTLLLSLLHIELSVFVYRGEGHWSLWQTVAFQRVALPPRHPGFHVPRCKRPNCLLSPCDAAIQSFLELIASQ